MGMASLVVFTLVCLLLAVPLRNNSMQSESEKLRSFAVESGGLFAERVNGAANIARVFSGIIEEMIETDIVPKEKRRELLLAEMKIMLKKGKRFNNNFWCSLEPDALDGMDQYFAGRPEGSSRGLFTPWLSEGRMIMNDDDDHEGNDYYRIPKRTGREFLTEPYWDEFDAGDSILMFSICVPVMLKGEFLGVVGTDFYANDMAELISQHDEDVEVKIVTNEGNIAVCHDETQIGGQAENGNREILDRLQAGEMFEGIYEVDGEKIYKIYVPIYLGEDDKPWFYAIDTPMENIYEQARETETYLIVCCLIGVALTAFAGWALIRRILKDIFDVTDIIRMLSLGRLDILIAGSQNRDEIGAMKRELQQLTEGLKRTAQFAHEIGGGNIDAEYQLLSDADILGNSLLEMRINLQKTEEKQALNAKEEKQRNWASEGLAKFADIMRLDNDNMETLSYNIIVNLVDYMNANQGGLFIVNEAENAEDRVLEMKACYAFDRKKYTDRKIRPGEGLVGACFKESRLIYLTDIPEDYISITSGFGGASPKSLLICPLKVNDDIFGVVELASFECFEPYQIEFVKKMSESIAATISNVRVNIRTNFLLSQTKLQAEEMSNQEEELRQNMEEMRSTQEEMRRKTEADEVAYKKLSEDMAAAEYQLTTSKLIEQAYSIGIWDMQVAGHSDHLNPKNPVRWSDELRQMLGYSGESEFPNVLGSWSNILHPDDRDKILDAFARHLLDRTGKTPFNVEYRLLKKDGEYDWFHDFGATTRDDSGYAVSVAGAIQNITETKNIVAMNENQLTKLGLVLKASKIGLWDMQVVFGDPVNPNNSFQWSDDFRQMLGYTSEIEFPNILSSWSDRLHPEDKDETLEAFSQHLLDQTGETPYDLEYRLLKKDGTYSYFHAFGATIRDENGYALRVVGAIKDISEIKALVSEIEELKTALEKSKTKK
jgi:methyl-accepting chemotaxis protein